MQQLSRDSLRREAKMSSSLFLVGGLMKKGVRGAESSEAGQCSVLFAEPLRHAPAETAMDAMLLQRGNAAKSGKDGSQSDQIQRLYGVKADYGAANTLPRQNIRSGQGGGQHISGTENA